jgi:uncharacterized protein YndB with AHSA1/START domain
MSVEPIHRSVVVDAPVEDAWVVFTARMASWWPLATHSLGHDDVESVVLEPRVGGRLFERRHDGAEHDWGRVVAWDPPNRLTVEWHVIGDDGDPPSEWEVRFTPNGAGTLVELEHRGFERLAAAGPQAREDYHGGWPTVLDAFAASY